MGIPLTPVQPRPAHLGLPLTPFDLPAQHPQLQTVYPSPFSHNTHTMLATPPIQFYQNTQSPYLPIPYPYPYYYPTNTPSSSQQPSNIHYNPYQWQYPHTPPPPPP